MLRIWHHVFGDAGGAEVDEILSLLADAGIEATPLDIDAPHGSGVVIFRRVCPELRELLREVSAGGRERVLLIALSRAALGGSSAWALLQAGASDVMAWDATAAAASQAAARLARWAEVDDILRVPLVERNLVGRAPAWTGALRRIVEVARFTDASVLLEGESGTGKELAARLVHGLDGRPNKKDLIVVDCTTIVSELSGSEFFGHERGAYTGAIGPREGAFALANGGTLFLDEIGELPLPLQAQLLRVVQERTYKRVGGNTWQQTHFRLVCATNRDLLAEVERGAFRRDLYYRIASTVCRLPPLRERVEDILVLARHFMESLRPGEPAPGFDDEVREHLLQRAYPGNVRDLQQLVTRILLRHVGVGPITVGDMPDEEWRAKDGCDDWREGILEQAVRRAITLGAGLKDIGRTAEEIAVRVAVLEEEGNLQRAASRLGVTDRALQLRRAARRQLD
jgi:transcriptional regulator with GAF, ATPase, and Fis domain